MGRPVRCSGRVSSLVLSLGTCTMQPFDYPEENNSDAR